MPDIHVQSRAPARSGGRPPARAPSGIAPRRALDRRSAHAILGLHRKVVRSAGELGWVEEGGRMPTAHETNVFVSSVYQELVEYRRAALDAVWRCDLYPDGMEREDVAK